MTKTELIANVAEKAGMTKKMAAQAVESILSEIKETLVKGEKLSLIGFGTFEVRERSARSGRNPQTGETIEIPASKAPAFKASKALKEEVNA